MTTPEATPRPWYWEPGDRLLAVRVGSEGHRRGVGDYAFITFAPGIGEDQGDPDADAALIVEAVNNYDRLRKIEAAARAFMRAVDPRHDDVIPEFAALRAALDEESQP